MPLVVATLQADLQDLMTNHGATAAACAADWATAFGSYASAIVPPSTTVAAAQATLQGALTAAFSSSNGLAAMDAAFTAAAATIALGMLPAYTGVPPAAPIGWASVLAEPYSPTAAAAATKVATAIHTWMLTGTGTLVAPPFTVTPWS